MEIVRTKDTGTLQYDIYFNDGRSSGSADSSRGPLVPQTSTLTEERAFKVAGPASRIRRTHHGTFVAAKFPLLHPAHCGSR